MERKHCLEDGCDRPVEARGLCRYHYRKVRSSEPDIRTCSIEGCERPHMARGWCINHYTRWWKYGSPHVVHGYGELQERYRREMQEA